MKKEYYIQGDPARAEEIKAAFKAKGIDTASFGLNHDEFLYYSSNGLLYFEDFSNVLLNVFKTNPGYTELPLSVEHDFKVGDWIVRGEGFVYEPSLITEIRDYYICELLNGERVTYTSNDVHKNFHLWTIADAKDGDVLATGNIICIFKKLDKDGYYIISPCIYTVKDGLEVIDDEDDTIGSCGFKPATKEDRELLFRKMKEAGYEWDADKKELRKIQHYDISNFHEGMPVLVRDDNSDEWNYLLFSHYRKKFSDHFFAGGSPWCQCIPFGEETKHLLGTTDPCDERYINW